MPVRTVNIGGFLRFGRKEHIYDLFENGTVYCNTLKFFRDHENPAIGDKYEGTSRLVNTAQIKSFEITIPGDQSTRPIKLNPSSIHLREFYSDPILNLYCLYTVDTDEVIKKEIYRIDEEMTRFEASHLIIIHTPGVFIERMVKAIRTADRHAEYGFVDYYDKKTYSGDLNLFHKPNEFAYQKEFRFVIGNDVQQPLILKLGSLKDISIVLEATALPSLEFRRIAI